jgi:protein gp37
VAADSKIEWCDHTVNFWWGCAKVSPACAHCYAEAQAARFYPGHWGQDAPRRVRVEAARKEALRQEALDIIMSTPHLDWLILTKRPENILPALREAQRRAQEGDMGFA